MPRDPLLIRIREYSEITNLGPICRRYFVIGAFDGALTVLGIIFGAIVAGAGEQEKFLVIAMGMSAAIALAISSIIGAYEAERVERRMDQLSMERAMLSEISDTHRNAFRFATIVSAGVHGMAPLIAALVPVAPFLFMDFLMAASWSIPIAFGLLFTMGIYLGGLAKEKILITGLRFVAAGLLTAIILLILGVRA